MNVVHLMRPNLRTLGVRLQNYTNFSTCTLPPFSTLIQRILCYFCLIKILNVIQSLSLCYNYAYTDFQLHIFCSQCLCVENEINELN